MRIAWFSPLIQDAPLKTASTTWSLLPHLREKADVELFLDEPDLRAILADGDGDGEISDHLGDVKTFHYLRAYQRHQEQPFDAFVYLLEDHPRANFVELTYRMFPGAVIFFDQNFNRLEMSRLSHATTGAQLNAEMDQLFGADSARLGEYQARGWSLDVFDKIYPRGQERFSNAALAFCPYAQGREELKRTVPQITVENFREAVLVPQMDNAEQYRRELRARLGYSDEQVVIAATANSFLYDRLPQICEAAADLLGRHSKLRLLCVAKDRAAEDLAGYWLEKYDLNHHPAVEVLGADSAESLFSLLSACDIFLRPRFDLLRSVPISVHAAMARGRACVVSDLGATGELPNDTVLKIPVGGNEALAISEAIKGLLENPTLRKQLGVNAQRHIETEHNGAKAADEFLGALKRNIGMVSQQFDQQMLIYRRKKRELLEELSFRERARGVPSSLIARLSQDLLV